MRLGIPNRKETAVKLPISCGEDQPEGQEFLSITECYRFFTADYLFRPLVELSDAIRAGRPTQGQRVAEFEALSNAYNDMRVELAKREALERQWRHVEKMQALGALTSRIAHDVNNGLATILGNLQLIGPKQAAGQSIEANLRRAEDATLNAAGVLRDVLNFSRAAELSATSTTEDLAEIMRGEFVGKPDADEIELTVEIQSSARLAISRSEASNAIVNLTVNSIEALGGAGRIRFVARPAAQSDMGSMSQRAEDYVAIDIIDDGPGVPRDIEGKIFEPFFTTKQARGGSGLGLWSVHQTMKACGGAIVYHREPSGWSRFTLVLQKVERDDDATPRHTSERPARRAAESLRILVVEDRADLLTTYGDAIAAFGAEYRACATCAEAIQALRSGERFDAVITDYELPDGNGLEVLGAPELKRSEAVKILISGYLNDVNPASVETIDYVYLKPVAMHDILKELCRSA